MQREYGGYLPLELPQKQEYFGRDANVLRLNSGRSAICAALAQARPARVWLPYYNCDSVWQAVMRAGIPAQRYRLGEDWLPQCPPLAEGEWLLYVNYFGTASPQTLQEVKRRWPRLILDCTQAFFCRPLPDADSYSVYSCRKFFGVPDGAYLIHDGLAPADYPPDSSWRSAGFLLRCIDENTNSAYADSMENEKRFEGGIRTMSPLTQRILASIDYEAVRCRRRRNYETLCRRLQPYNGFACPPDADTAMVYPFYCECPALRRRLIEHKVYVSQWWKYLLELLPPDSLEARFSNWLLPLPVDQRYTPADMEELADLVLSLREELM